ncbi:MAG TPA: DEAD/DEAH box helicase family protein, partial [Candidatus Udaeobacter sp.]|nr:DEAD/DEAH box helicase family protein [Candidatus Udaeobacter sp.]
MTIEEFRRRVANDGAGLVSRLQEETGRYGNEESQAWESSLSKLSHAFQAPSFQPLHLFFGTRGNLALEYQLPAASSWADVVLLGRYETAPAAVIIELKDWTTAADRPGKAEGLIDRAGRQELHPSDQVRGYTEYCRRFHSAIEGDAKVHGCVLFTHQPYTHAYTSAPNDALTRDYPIFTTATEDVGERFPSFFKTRLLEPDEQFARRFAAGRYRQQRGFVAQIGAQILDPQSTPFELLDNQRRAFALCQAVVYECFLRSAKQEPKKRVVIVEGPPGSGKSAIAARLWASLVTDNRLPEGDVVFTTTSQSQNSNWSAIFDQLAEEGGQGLVRKATIFTPLTTHKLGHLRRQHGEAFIANASDWRVNLQLLRNLGLGFPDASRDDQNLVTIVDEAHSLINPEHNAGRGQFGFVTGLGPQAYHIIRASQLTIFLLDPAQG